MSRPPYTNKTSVPGEARRGRYADGRDGAIRSGFRAVEVIEHSANIIEFGISEMKEDLDFLFDPECSGQDRVERTLTPSCRSSRKSGGPLPE